MEAKYNKFTEFDWKNKEWQKYVKSLFPVPREDQVLTLKKRWYKRHIDQEFDETYEPPKIGDNTVVAPPSQVEIEAFASMGPQGLIIIQTYLVALVVAWLSLMGIVEPRTAILLLSVAPAMEVVSKYGIQFTKDHLKTVMIDEAGSLPLIGLAFCIPGYHPAFHTMVFMPMGVGALLSFGMFCAHYRGVPAFLSNNLSFLAEAEQRHELRKTRADFELVCGLAFIVGIPIGICSHIGGLLFWNMLALRYLWNPFSRDSFRKLDNCVRPILKFIPGDLYAKFKDMCHDVLKRA